MKYFTKISILFLSLFIVTACSNETSLQKYYVEKQKDNAFITVDLPSSLLKKENNTLTQEQLETLKSIKKLNILALQNKEENKSIYEGEKEKVASILTNEKYKSLMKFGSNTKGVDLKFTGEEDAIDELIVFASDGSKGFTLIRVLGDDMEPSQIIKLMQGMNDQNFDFSFMSEIASKLN